MTARPQDPRATTASFARIRFGAVRTRPQAPQIVFHTPAALCSATPQAGRRE